MPRDDVRASGTSEVTATSDSDIFPPLLIASVLLIGLWGAGCAGVGSGTSETLHFRPERFHPAQYTPEGVEYDTVYTPDSVDTPPAFEEGVRRALQKVNYPDRAKRNGVTGDVWVGFVVSPSGAPRHVQVIKPVHPLLDMEAHRVVSTSEFSPGYLNESAVPVKVALPITFNLRNR